MLMDLYSVANMLDLVHKGQKLYSHIQQDFSLSLDEFGFEHGAINNLKK